MYTYWLSLIDIYIHNLLANCCWYVERNWQAFIVAILWFFIWNTFDAIIKHLKLNSKMHSGHFSLCIWNVHTWAMEERWMPIYHFLPFWKLFHTVCVVLTWFVRTDWWAVTRVLCVCVCVYSMFTAFVHWVQYVCQRVSDSVCVSVCMCLVRLGLFSQLFGGKAWSHVTLCFSSCSRIRTTGSLCQETRRMGPNPVYPAFSGFPF